MRYANIRLILGELIGRRLIDITQHDPEDFAKEGPFVMLMFDDGGYVKFPITREGFNHNCERLKVEPECGG